ncbi:MAG: hypothetical protein J3K34DRAFT_398073 [Monoraphidium minutum]|nr:MAG: hypothetical protein J3K34DRAFT_398073 [Monoraphidium minutum]
MRAPGGRMRSCLQTAARARAQPVYGLLLAPHVGNPGGGDLDRCAPARFLRPSHPGHLSGVLGCSHVHALVHPFNTCARGPAGAPQSAARRQRAGTTSPPAARLAAIDSQTAPRFSRGLFECFRRAPSAKAEPPLDPPPLLQLLRPAAGCLALPNA